MIDLDTIRAALSVGAGVAQLVAGIVTDVHAFKHHPDKLGDLADDLADKVPDIIRAVKTGTVAAFEPTIEPAQSEKPDPGPDAWTPDAAR